MANTISKINISNEEYDLAPNWANVTNKPDTLVYEDELDTIELITLDDIDEICNGGV